MEQLGYRLTDFSEILYWAPVLKSVDKNACLTKTEKRSTHFTRRTKYVYSNISRRREKGKQ
jgi:hypothetical protein